MRYPVATFALLCISLGWSTPALAVCGDGAIDGADACDDGNLVDGDGCSSVCAVEAGFSCETLEALSGLNPSFEAPVDGSNWELVSGSIDWLDQTSFGGCYPAGDGRYSIDLNGSSQGVIAQPLATVVGQKYLVSFLASANCIEVSGQACNLSCARTLTVGVAESSGDAALDVTTPTRSAGFQVFGSPQATPWQRIAFDFVASTSTTLLYFSGSDTRFAGPMLDGISIPVSLCHANRCGDGVLDPGEACDDGNNIGGDGCTSECGAIENGYVCATPGQLCAPPCGDGIKQNTEACDDGNLSPGDGCDATCGVEAGWACIVAPPSVISTCMCAPGFQDMGGVCVDVDECAAATHDCDPRAACTNTPGAFTCVCEPGYEGDGRVCTDIDECASGTDSCDANARCTNTDGSFSCACDAGYEGDGSVCADIDECATGADNCAQNASCTNTDGAFTCACPAGIFGDGTVCTCGDGILDGTDACDDGNLVDGDGCSATCTKEVGFICERLETFAIENASFEDPFGAGNWSIISGTIDRLDGRNNACFPAGEGSVSLDLNGTTQGVIGQEVSAVVGQKYGVTFLASANCVTRAGMACDLLCERQLTAGVAESSGDAAADVRAAFKTVEYDVSGSPKSSNGWQAYRFEFVATSTRLLLFFSGSDSNAAGPMIDGIAVSAEWCRPLNCGDGVVDPGEVCDDGNFEGGDGCTSDCQTVEAGYACPATGGACSAGCGDGRKQNAEACDDGNETDGDGCSKSCTVEAKYSCEVTPPAVVSVCACATPGTCGGKRSSGGGSGCATVGAPASSPSLALAFALAWLGLLLGTRRRPAR